jgi:predicted RNA binding protein with dsRBD fold (UPF0201 family)
MDEINVYVETEINPTESKDKVETAVENIFSNIPLQVKQADKGRLLVAEAEELKALTKLCNLLRRERIRNAARKALFEGLKGNVISFCLNKQVAYAGHVSFSGEVAESPLGPIKVRIECKNPRELINWLAPKTV